MTRMSVEIEGSVDEVVGVLRRLGSAGQRAAAGDDGGSMEAPAGGGEQTESAAGERMTGALDEAAPGEWTGTLASEFLSGLDPMARRMTRHVWRAGAAGIHRSALCQRAELTPAELRSLLVRMSHALRRFGRRRGATLSRPVVSNAALQSYCVDPDFAAVATARMFDEGTTGRLAGGAGR